MELDHIGPYVYRGTTVDWPGNVVLQEEELTCASTDPLVAVLFAIECQRHGPAILQLANWYTLKNLAGPSNHFPAIECAINFKLTPKEFSAHVRIAVDAQTAREALVDMGFDVPVFVADRLDLQEAILDSHDRRNRLSETQIREFNELILRRAP